MSQSRMSTEKIRQNLSILGRRTSLALESGVWESLTEICRREETSLDELCEDIVAQSKDISMASAIRIHALEYFMAIVASHPPAGPANLGGQRTEG